MPLQKIEYRDINPNVRIDPASIPYLNQIIDYCNALEQRLADLEKKTETILMVKEKDELFYTSYTTTTHPHKCNCDCVHASIK